MDEAWLYLYFQLRKCQGWKRSKDDKICHLSQLKLKKYDQTQKWIVVYLSIVLFCLSVSEVCLKNSKPTWQGSTSNRPTCMLSCWLMQSSFTYFTSGKIKTKTVRVHGGDEKHIMFCTCSMWYDQAKSVWSRWHSILNFLHDLKNYIYFAENPTKIGHLYSSKDMNKCRFWKTIRKQTKLFSVMDYILKSVLPTNDWFSLIISHMFPYMNHLALSDWSEIDVNRQN